MWRKVAAARRLQRKADDDEAERHPVDEREGRPAHDDAGRREGRIHPRRDDLRGRGALPEGHPDAMLRPPSGTVRRLPSLRGRAGGRPQPRGVVHDGGPARDARAHPHGRPRDAAPHPHGDGRLGEPRHRRRPHARLRERRRWPSCSTATTPAPAASRGRSPARAATTTTTPSSSATTTTASPATAASAYAPNRRATTRSRS